MNTARYIDSAEPEDIQNITAQSHGGIPAVDIGGLAKVPGCISNFKGRAFGCFSDGFYQLKVEEGELRRTVYNTQ